MTTTPKALLGFVSPSGRHGSHYDDFLALVPTGVEVQIQGLALYESGLDQLSGKLDTHVARTAELVLERGWAGIALMGAPMEVQNRGFTARIRDAIAVPATSALEAGAAALRAMSARRALLLTPFDERLKALLKEHLSGEGIDAMLPSDSFASVSDAVRTTPDEVYELARDALAAAPGAQAIYFQGAPLNPLPVIERIESDLGVPVVASNPAMLWHICAKLELTFSVEGGGRLLREWPSPVAA